MAITPLFFAKFSKTGISKKTTRDAGERILLAFAPGTICQ